MTQSQLLAIAGHKYPYMSCTVFIRQELSREQYKRVQELWGYIMDPYRESADFYTLTFSDDDHPLDLVNYLEENKMRYALEIQLSRHEELM